MSNPLQQTIEALAKEKGIEPDIVITAIEDAVLTASRKYYKTNETLRTKFNRDTGQVELFAVRQIVQEVTNPETEISLDEARQLYGAEAEVDMQIEFPKATDVLGRIAAQAAKQVIFQKVREAERENVYAEYSQRLGEVVTGTVKRFENGDLIVETGRIEALLARRDQSRAENYTAGDRVRAVIKGVNQSTKGPQIILSRTDPALLIKLFEQEVPEIYDGTVVIRGAVREAGDRAKVAVFSRERDVDPVGACVGMKGTRVQSIIRELRGEKIDIVQWSDDSITFVTNAISPARVQRVSIVGEAERVVEVVVEDTQLSLAIGKKGQNVRLAAKLTGWRIDIKSEEEKRREVEAQFEGLEAAPEGLDAAGPSAGPTLSEEMLQKLGDAGLDSAERIADTAAEELSRILDIDQDAAESIRAAYAQPTEGDAPESDGQAASAQPSEGGAPESDGQAASAQPSEGGAPESDGQAASAQLTEGVAPESDGQPLEKRPEEQTEG